MSWIFIAIVIVAIAAVILSKLSKRDSADLANYPYQSSGVLFTPAERSFHGVLEQSLGGSAKVLGKVRVADVITPIKGLSRGEWQKAFNKISANHFDFVLKSAQ